MGLTSGSLTSMQNPPKDHWSDLAQKWNRLASPLRPCPEDVGIIQQALAPGGGSYLLLGVTPELTSPAGHLIALDHNAAMVAAVWPGNHGGRSAVQGDWLQMPFAAHSFDAIIGDGSLTLLSYPSQYRGVLDQCKQVLKPGGKILIRLFASPEQTETCAEVCAAARDRRIDNFHAFKWRLSMALAAETHDVHVNVADTHAAFNRLLPDRKSLAETTGWALEAINTIDFYAGSVARYSYPSLAQVRAILAPDFRETGLTQGSYELAERCPTLILERDE